MATVERMLLAVDGPPPKAPEFNLLTVADKLATGITPEGGFDPHWANGIELWLYPPDLPSGHDPCSDIGSLEDKEEPSARALVDGFESWTAYLGDICTSRGLGDWGEFVRRANVALAAREAWAVERQLVSGIFTTQNPHLGDANVTVLDSSGASPVEGVAALEEAIAGTGQAGILHLTPGVVTALGFDHLQLVAGKLRTAAGTLVVSGQGYVGAPPPAPEDVEEAAAEEDEAWCYASVGVVWDRSDQIILHPPTQREAMAGRMDNTVIYRAERDYVVGFDPLLQAAILIDESL